MSTTQEIKKLLTNASPGPWTPGMASAMNVVSPSGIVASVTNAADAELIVAMRVMLPHLLAIAEAANVHHVTLKLNCDCPMCRSLLGARASGLFGEVVK
jgi:hypothetical protein